MPISLQPMRTLLNNIHGRSFFFLFGLRNARCFPPTNCMSRIVVGSIWVSPLFANRTKIIGDYKQIATQAYTEEEVTDENLNRIIAVIENDSRSNGEIYDACVDKLCKAEKLSTASRLLHLLREKNIFVGPNPYNLLLAAASKKNDIEVLTGVFKDLVVTCKSLPLSVYLDVAKGFMKASDHAELLRFVKEVSELTFPGNTVIINKIMFVFGDCGQSDKAILIFEQIKSMKCKPDLITYNTILDILGRAGRVDEMLYQFASMKEARIAPDFISYNTILNHLKKLGRLDLCKVYFREMVESGIEPDLLTYTALIEGFGRSGNSEEVLRLFSEMKAKKIRPSVYIYRSLINNLKKMGRVELARTFLEEMNASLSNLAGPKDFKRKDR